MKEFQNRAVTGTALTGAAGGELLQRLLQLLQLPYFLLHGGDAGIHPGLDLGRALLRVDLQLQEFGNLFQGKAQRPCRDG